MSDPLEGKGLFSWQEAQERKSSNTYKVQGLVGPSISKPTLASTLLPTWFSSETCYYQQLMTWNRSWHFCQLSERCCRSFLLLLP